MRKSGGGPNNGNLQPQVRVFANAFRNSRKSDQL